MNNELASKIEAAFLLTTEHLFGPLSELAAQVAEEHYREKIDEWAAAINAAFAESQNKTNPLE